jgi:TPR repeat protein
LEKKLEIVTSENVKLKQLAKSQVENIIEPAAKQGDVGATQVVGECYQFGLGGKQSEEKTSIEYYEKGVLAENPASQCSLGQLLLERKDDVKANERGVDLLKKSAAANNPKAQYHLAWRQLHGNGKLVAKDEKNAVELLKKAATNGNALSQFELGRCYETGTGGVEKDTKQAEHWYLKAAESGNMSAQFNLGHIYLVDEKLKDINKAIDWFEKAYNNGHADAAAQLAFVFQPDSTPAPDRDQAILWAYRARKYAFTARFLDLRLGKNSFPTAIKGLYRTHVHERPESYILFTFSSFCKEMQLVLVLVRRFAALGCPASMYVYAESLPDDHPSKLKYIQRSASDGAEPFPMAQWCLGECYETGRCGLAKNAVLAKTWKDKATANGYKPSE